MESGSKWSAFMFFFLSNQFHLFIENGTGFDFVTYELRYLEFSHVYKNNFVKCMSVWNNRKREFYPIPSFSMVAGRFFTKYDSESMKYDKR